MKLPPLTLPAEPGCVPITLAQLSLYLSPAEIEAGEQRGKSVHVGPWQLVRSYRALCVRSNWDEKARESGITSTKSVTIWGRSTLSRPTESGYSLEGFVSIGGRKVSAFTSSQLFKVIETGKLVSVATIFPRL